MGNNSIKKPQKNWTREEIMLALELYCIIPKGQDTVHNKNIIALANVINRTPGSVKLKLQNIKSYDPAYTQNGRIGLNHGSQLDKEICDEFFQNLDTLFVDTNCYETKLPLGNDVEKMHKERIGQSLFRNMLLKIYDNKCCITGIAMPELLKASHIKPWSKCNETEKTNPQNGLLLNALHDAAFDKGYMTISLDYKIIVSKKLLDSDIKFLKKYHEQKIILPSKLFPSEQFIEYHNEYIFKK